MVSLTDRAQCVQMSSIDMGLDYDSTVMLTCKLYYFPQLLFATSVLICPSSHKLCLLDCFFSSGPREGGIGPPRLPPFICLSLTGCIQVHVHGG